MAKIYISSTYEDLKKEREAAAQAVRRLGHQAIAMEDYVSSDQRPVDKCLQDVKSCDAYVGIFAWRYGYIPEGYDKSITHLEYEAAKKAGIPCLIFLLDKKAPWPVENVSTGDERQKINQLRRELKNDYTVSFFKNADQLSGLVSAAVSNIKFPGQPPFNAEIKGHKVFISNANDIEIPGNNVVEKKGFEQYLSNAMDYYINENYEKAWSNILEAEIIKSSDKVRHLKRKIEGKIAEKKEKQRLVAETREKPGDMKTVESKAKKVYKNPQGFQEADFGDGIIMVSIPPGKFEMGSNEDYYEKPPHTVYLDGYWMGKYEVTVKQFGLFVKDTGYVTQAESDGGVYTRTGRTWVQKKDINWKNPGFKQEDSHPVVCVSWNDALEYCKWLSGKKGVNFKLPTEAQWERAARGTDKRKYPWGNSSPSGEKVNFADKQFWLKQKLIRAEKDIDDGYAYTAPVGTYLAGASAYGLLDMAGNVWEWCNDWYDETYYESSPNKNPTGPKGGTSLVMRGGSWGNDAFFLRCSYRGNHFPSSPRHSVGFRLCLDNK